MQIVMSLQPVTQMCLTSFGLQLPQTVSCMWYLIWFTHCRMPCLCAAAGYLPLEAGNSLLSCMYKHSAPGSRIIVTVPPGPAVKAARDRAQAAAAGDTDVAPVHMGEGAGGGVSTVQANMPHVTFEEPSDTLSR
jgi:hypothetical protein